MNLPNIEEFKKITQEGKRDKKFLMMKGYAVHRNISLRISYYLMKFFPKVSPNIISVLMVFVGLLGVVLVFFNGWISVIGVFVIYTSFILDKVDGEIARYKQIFSIEGIYMDELYHTLVTGLFPLALLFPLMEKSKLFLILVPVTSIITIVNRYNRKISLIIYMKFKKSINNIDNGIKKERSSLVKKTFSSWFFRIFSAIERFDLILGLAILLLVIYINFDINFRREFLFFYLLFSVGYFIRWVVLNNNGYLNTEILRLNKEGY